jgi:signal transduction histidine kinase
MLSEAPQHSGDPAHPAVKALGRISKLIREMADNMDGIVWATNPKNDTLDHFVLYVFEYFDSLAHASQMRILRDVPSPLPSCLLTSTQRHNLFLVLKEAMNNVLKHAHASEASFKLVIESGRLRMALDDNGRGFMTGTTSELGNGLVNMEKRMSTIGGMFVCASTPGKGTRIEVEMPISNEENTA